MTKIRDGEAKKRGKVRQTISDIPIIEMTPENRKKPLDELMEMSAPKIVTTPIKPVVKMTAPKKPRTPKAPK